MANKKSLRTKIDEITAEAIKLTLGGYDKTETFTYDALNTILNEALIIYRNKLAKLIKESKK